MTEVRERRDVPAGAPPIHYHNEGGANSRPPGGEIEKSRYADGNLSKSFERQSDV
jgi:hypothetical protein